jgi:hypothetical protein
MRYPLMRGENNNAWALRLPHGDRQQPHEHVGGFGRALLA